MGASLETWYEGGEIVLYVVAMVVEWGGEAYDAGEWYRGVSSVDVWQCNVASE